MDESTEVTAALTSRYKQFSSHDPELFAAALASCDGVSYLPG